MNSNKNAKMLQKQQANTIDEKHNELLEHFRDLEITKIPEIEKEIIILKDKVKTLDETQIEQYLDIRDKIISLRSNLKLLKFEKKRYLLDNSKYIFHYFEQKQQISSGTVTTQNSNAVNSFFKIKSVTNEAANPQSDKYAQSKKAYQNYWRNVGSELPNIQNFIITSDLCEICNVGEMIPQDEEGILICNNQGCGKFITYIVDSSKPTNKEPPNEVSYTAYIRLNHFKEILSQFQAKETTQIPEEVINAIKARIKKERIKDMSLINYDKMRDILRKLGFNKYFEHIQYINSLFGIKPPIMNEELHETLCVLFIEIQKPWAVHCPANRTNFFNYTYTLHQLCVLLDQTQYLPYIPMMKDREKQLEQDMIWKKVCNDLDWEYFPSV
jgi:hypothetical protein